MRYGSSALGCVRQVTTLLALTLLAAVLAAQDYRGRIQGVVRDSSEGRLVTEEYRRKMKVYMPHRAALAPTPANTALRLLGP